MVFRVSVYLWASPNSANFKVNEVKDSVWICFLISQGVCLSLSLFFHFFLCSGGAEIIFCDSEVPCALGVTESKVVT